MTSKEEKNPLWVHCADEGCDHDWVAVWLPMEVNKAAKIMEGQRYCPRCASANVKMGRRPGVTS